MVRGKDVRFLHVDGAVERSAIGRRREELI